MNSRNLAALLLATAVLGGCATGTASPGTTSIRALASDVGTPPPSAAPGSSTDPSEAPSTSNGAPTTAAEDPGDATAPATAGPTGPAPTSQPTPDPSASPTPVPTPTYTYEREFPVEARLASTCVRAGTPMTLVVDTEEDAAVGYLAWYANGDNGAIPPYGQGHGGNDGGIADSDGHYESTWTVSANAPRGRGYVNVIVASQYGGRWQEDLPFTVIDPVTGSC